MRVRCSHQALWACLFSLTLALTPGCTKESSDDGDGGSTDPSQTTDPSDATDPSDPSDGSDASDPSDASDVSDPDESDSTDPSDTTDSSDSSDTSDPGDESDTSDPGSTFQALAITSNPTLAASATEPFRYRVILNKPGAASYELTAGPASAVMEADGSITWTPTEDDSAGVYDFSVTVALDIEVVTQSFQVHLSEVVIQTEAVVDTSTTGTATVAVTEPLSPINGAGIIIPEGAVPDGTNITIGAVDSPAPIPAIDVHGIDVHGIDVHGIDVHGIDVHGIDVHGSEVEGGSQSLAVVDFGPSGTVFAEPVSILLPLMIKPVEVLNSCRKRCQGIPKFGGE